METGAIEAGGGLQEHRVVSREEWLAARKAFLEQEKAFTRARDELSRARRELPWERVARSYLFDGPRGQETLGDLFAGRRQLLVYHFMFAPEWDEGCPHCSFWADSFDRVDVHLAHRDTSLVAVSRAPVEKLEAFRKRMGWSFRWLSSGRNEFNYDLGVSFRPEELRSGSAVYNYRRGDPGHTDREGLSAFTRDGRGEVFHTYSTYARGIDLVNCAYNLLDLTARGRDEDGREVTQAWVRHHDRDDR